jgi:hypothetical protein
MAPHETATRAREVSFPEKPAKTLFKRLWTPTQGGSRAGTRGTPGAQPVGSLPRAALPASHRTPRGGRKSEAEGQSFTSLYQKSEPA